MRAAAAVAVALTATSPGASGVRYLQSHQLASGGFSEPGQAADPQLTAWATLGIRAAEEKPGASTARYLEQHEAELSSATDLALVAMAEAALGQAPERALARLRALERPNGSVGRLVNGSAWAVLAFRASGRPVDRATVRWLLGRQAPGGCWGWTRGAVDSNDTAAVVQALRSVNVRGRPIRRALRCLASYRRGDGGFELVRGRGSDAQSTAWAVQAFVAAGKAPPRGALAYLRRLQRSDGSYRYSRRYVATPVWVTAQVLPALARKPFPLR